MTHKIPNLSAIDTNRIEGRLLITALAMLTGEGENTSKHPDEVLALVCERAEYIYKDASPLPETIVDERRTFEQDIAEVLNRHSAENNSGTPDYILAKFLHGCLQVFDVTVSHRTKWFGMNAISKADREIFDQQFKKIESDHG